MLVITMGQNSGQLIGEKVILPKGESATATALFRQLSWTCFPIFFSLTKQCPGALLIVHRPHNLVNMFTTNFHRLHSYFVKFPHLSSKNQCVGQHSILTVKTQEYKGFAILPYLQANRLTWHSSMAAGRRHETTESEIGTVHHSQQ